MKRFLFILLMGLPVFLLAQNKVAVYVTSTDAKVDDAMKQIVGGELVAAIVQTNQYKAVERTADFLKQISKEQGYQRSGNVDDKQISAIGKQFGVNYVCVANILPYENNYYIQARMIDVETVTVVAFAREVSSMSSLDAIVITASRVAQALVNPNKSNAAQLPTTLTPQKEQKTTFVSKIDDAAVRDFYINHSCPEAYAQYYKGRQMITAGWSLLGIGSGLMFVGGMCLMDYSHKNYSSSNRRDVSGEVLCTHLVFMPIGVSCVAASATLLPLGNKQMNKAHKTYDKKNNIYALELQTSSNGLGLAFKF